MRLISNVGILVLTMVVSGCSGAPLRTERSTSGIRAAEAVGAANVPNASLHLQLAKEQLATAKLLAAEGEKEQAASMLSRAEADAELAVMLSHEETERRDAEKAIARVRELQQNNQ